MTLADFDVNELIASSVKNRSYDPFKVKEFADKNDLTYKVLSAILRDFGYVNVYSYIHSSVDVEMVDIKDDKICFEISIKHPANHIVLDMSVFDE